MGAVCLVILHKNDNSSLSFAILLYSPIVMLARAPALLALAIDISTSRKSRINLYWAWVIWMLCASDSWPNKHSASLAAMLVSNCLIWSGVIKAWKSSSVFSQCHLAQFLRNADDHRLTLSLREINFSIKQLFLVVQWGKRSKSDVNSLNNSALFWGVFVLK